MSRVRLLNIPNVLTVLRLLLLPGIIALFRSDHFLLASNLPAFLLAHWHIGGRSAGQTDEIAVARITRISDEHSVALVSELISYRSLLPGQSRPD